MVGRGTELFNLDGADAVHPELTETCDAAFVCTFAETLAYGAEILI